MSSILERLQQRHPKPPVHVPGTELGDDTYIRVMTGADYDAAIETLKSANGGEVSVDRPRLVALTLCDADGKAALDISNPEHIALVGALSNDDLGKLFSAATEANGLRPTRAAPTN